MQRPQQYSPRTLELKVSLNVSFNDVGQAGLGQEPGTLQTQTGLVVVIPELPTVTRAEMVFAWSVLELVVPRKSPWL